MKTLTKQESRIVELLIQRRSVDNIADIMSVPKAKVNYIYYKFIIYDGAQYEQEHIKEHTTEENYQCVLEQARKAPFTTQTLAKRIYSSETTAYSWIVEAVERNDITEYDNLNGTVRWITNK